MACIWPGIILYACMIFEAMWPVTVPVPCSLTLDPCIPAQALGFTLVTTWRVAGPRPSSTFQRHPSLRSLINGPEPLELAMSSSRPEYKTLVLYCSASHWYKSYLSYLHVYDAFHTIPFRLHVHVLTFMWRRGGDYGGVTAWRDGCQTRDYCSSWCFNICKCENTG